MPNMFCAFPHLHDFVCSFVLTSFFCSVYSRPPAGSAVRVHPLLTLSSLLLLSLPTVNAACTTDP